MIDLKIKESKRQQILPKYHTTGKERETDKLKEQRRRQRKMLVA